MITDKELSDAYSELEKELAHAVDQCDYFVEETMTARSKP